MALKNSILIIILMFLTVITYSTPFFKQGIEEINYKENYGEYVNDSKLKIINFIPMKVQWESINDITTIETDKSLKTIKMNYESDNTNLNLIRKGNFIELSGTSEGEEVQKKLKIDDDPWYQLFVFSFTDFIFSDDKTRQYWVFNPFDLSMSKMKVEKISKEKITINEKTYDTFLLNTRLTGFMSIFWKGEYWFNSENGMYLKYDGLNIFPKIQNVIITAQDWR
ncbi:hypothetical protein SAMN04488588_0884 [Geotoga petraea]|uniref:Uncharacterized protein n=1 Tax=Geotoga petraea TaxID=28234 RepID=A0A1G6KTC5_9BACT|nr:hypothetical protein SAMN04488588_0884 [Geotoga petraea]